jgi:hypothetical protein
LRLTNYSGSRGLSSSRCHSGRLPPSLLISGSKVRVLDGRTPAKRLDPKNPLAERQSQSTVDVPVAVPARSRLPTTSQHAPVQGQEKPLGNSANFRGDLTRAEATNPKVGGSIASGRTIQFKGLRRAAERCPFTFPRFSVPSVRVRGPAGPLDISATPGEHRGSGGTLGERGGGWRQARVRVPQIPILSTCGPITPGVARPLKLRGAEGGPRADHNSEGDGAPSRKI